MNGNIPIPRASTTLDPTLEAIAGVSTGPDTLIYFNGVDIATSTNLSAFGRSLIDDANASGAQATLALKNHTSSLLLSGVYSFISASSTVEVGYMDEDGSTARIYFWGTVGPNKKHVITSAISGSDKTLGIPNKAGYLPVVAASTGAVSLAGSEVTGNLPTSKLNGGSGASASTFWRGDGTWAAVSAGLSIGSSAITGGTDGRILFNNAGVVGEKVVTGTGSVMLNTLPTLPNGIAGDGTVVGDVVIYDWQQSASGGQKMFYLKNTGGVAGVATTMQICISDAIGYNGGLVINQAGVNGYIGLQAQSNSVFSCSLSKAGLPPEVRFGGGSMNYAGAAGDAGFLAGVGYISVTDGTTTGIGALRASSYTAASNGSFVLTEYGASIGGDRSAALYDNGTGGTLLLTSGLGIGPGGSDVALVDVFLKRSSAGVFKVEDGASGTGGLIANVSKSVGQVVVSQTTTAGSTTNVIPADNTIPQNTEGAEIQTVTITPKNASSTLIIEWIGGIASSALNTVGLALFVDSTANALAAESDTLPAGAIATMKIRFSVSAGSTSARTYKVRTGPLAAGTVYWNQGNGGPFFGGTLTSIFTVTEILP